jgi:hypothetical protein
MVPGGFGLNLASAKIIALRYEGCVELMDLRDRLSVTVRRYRPSRTAAEASR